MLSDTIKSIKDWCTGKFQPRGAYLTRKDLKESEAATKSVYYGTCATAAGTAAKVVTVTDKSFVLDVGKTVMVKFGSTNTASNPTINVNGTGAKPIWYNTSQVTTASDAAGITNKYFQYTYDGTYWVLTWYGSDKDTTYNLLSPADIAGGTSTYAGLISAALLKDAIEMYGGGGREERYENYVNSSTSSQFTSSTKIDLTAQPDEPTQMPTSVILMVLLSTGNLNLPLCKEIPIVNGRFHDTIIYQDNTGLKTRDVSGVASASGSLSSVSFGDCYVYYYDGVFPSIKNDMLIPYKIYSVYR